jgi:hypothetical protein
VDASPITLGLLGAGILLAWSAIANRNPLDEIREGLGIKSAGRPLADATPKTSTTTPYGGVPQGTADGGAGVGGASTFRRWEDIVVYVKRAVPDVKVGSTTGGVHASGSRHYVGKAVDFPGSAGTAPDAQLDRVYAALLPLAQSGAIHELYYRSGAWRAGRSVPTVGGHQGHVHASTP